LPADTLYLFGKVLGEGNAWKSCCVRVPNLQHSLLVVPERHVFEAGDR
jgi:hypothetical protein